MIAEKVITLEQNLKKAANLVAAISSMSQPWYQGGTTYYQRKAKRDKLKCLRRSIKNLKRLTIVLDKQCKEGLRNNFR